MSFASKSKAHGVVGHGILRLAVHQRARAGTVQPIVAFWTKPGPPPQKIEKALASEMKDGALDLARVRAKGYAVPNIVIRSHVSTSHHHPLPTFEERERADGSRQPECVVSCEASARTTDKDDEVAR